jgi:hypothetical protein
MENQDLYPRFTFIELVAYWEGKVNTTHIAQQFGLSRQQSSAALNAYLGNYPNNLAYNKSGKAYQPTESFKLHFITGEADEYLHWLHTGYISQSLSSALYLPNTSLNLPARKISPYVMRGLVAGIRQQRRVDVEYVSLSNPSQIGRNIAPHAFVNTGLRWHLRAWCEKSGQFRDFVLSRFRGTAELLDKSPHTAEQDEAWSTQVTVILQPDPRLPPAKREVLENDYQMQNGQLHITTRGCLVQYLLREMQVNTKMLDGVPEAQQLVCVNLVDIKDWLFDS